MAKREPKDEEEAEEQGPTGTLDDADPADLLSDGDEESEWME